MKTICVVTWYKSNNFGTCLQAVALVKALEKMGYRVYMLAYGRRYTLKDWERILRKLKKKFQTKKGTTNQINSEKENNIQKCIDENMSFVTVKTKEDQKKTFEKIDCFVVGSDQVWNPDHFDEVYLLDFVPENIRKISYASSIGVEKLPETLQGKYKKYLERFDFISVRESKAAELIEKLVDKPVDVVLDPTFLLDGASWKLFAQKAQLEKNLPQKYILTYFVGNNISHWEEVKNISQATNLPVVVLPLENTDCDNDFLRCETAGTYEFVALIEGANLICTDSFHACAFSINLNKQFIAFRRFKNTDTKSQNSRLDELFDWTGIGNRYYEDNGMRLLSTDIDYKKVNSIVDKKRKECQEILVKEIS